jgi:hypothetical protein
VTVTSIGPKTEGWLGFMQPVDLIAKSISPFPVTRSGI